MKILHIQDKEILIDDQDFEKVNGLGNWYLQESSSGKHYVYWKSGKEKKIYLHRLITHAPKGMTVDHINNNPLDNRRSNLRLCSQKDNCRNNGMRKNNSSGYKGVTYSKKKKKWVAQLHADGKGHFLGHFDKPGEAAKVYDEAVVRYFGQFAKTNKEILSN